MICKKLIQQVNELGQLIVMIVRHKIPYKIVSTITSTIYGILLGLMFKSFFIISQVPNQADPRNVLVVIPLKSENILFALLVSIYFIFDWFSTIVTSHKLSERSQNEELYIEHWIPIILIIFILGLASSVLFSLQSDNIKYIIFGFYAIIVPGWDYFMYSVGRSQAKVNYGQNEKYFIFCYMPRQLLGCLILFFSFIKKIFNLQNSNSMIELMIIIYVILKIFRYGFFIYMNEHDKAIRNNSSIATQKG